MTAAGSGTKEDHGVVNIPYTFPEEPDDIVQISA
jgi:hypothetical protein